MTDIEATFPRVVRAEWGKFWSLRSSWIVLGSIAVLTVVTAGIVGWTARHLDTPTTIARAVGGATIGVDLFSLIVGVFGILLMTGEYSSGLIRASLVAVPRRLPVLWAKAIVLVAASVPLLFVALIAAFLVNQSFAAEPVSLAGDGVLGALVGAAVSPAVVGLLGLGLGTVLRHSAGAITAFVILMLVVPALLPALLTDSAEKAVMPYVPIGAMQVLYTLDTTAFPFPVLGIGAAIAVLAGWCAVALAGAAVALHRRDA